MMKSGQGPLKKVDSSPTMNLDKMLCHVTGTMACHQKIRQRTYIDSCHWTDHLQRKRLPGKWSWKGSRSKHLTGDIFTQHFPVLRIVGLRFSENPPVKRERRKPPEEASPAQRCHQGRAHQRMTAARPNQRVPLLGVETPSSGKNTGVKYSQWDAFWSN